MGEIITLFCGHQPTTVHYLSCLHGPHHLLPCVALLKGLFPRLHQSTAGAFRTVFILTVPYIKQVVHKYFLNECISEWKTNLPEDKTFFKSRKIYTWTNDKIPSKILQRMDKTRLTPDSNWEVIKGEEYVLHTWENTERNSYPSHKRNVLLHTTLSNY